MLVKVAISFIVTMELNTQEHRARTSDYRTYLIMLFIDSIHFNIKYHRESKKKINTSCFYHNFFISYIPSILINLFFIHQLYINSKNKTNINAQKGHLMCFICLIPHNIFFVNQTIFILPKIFPYLIANLIN